jgi:Ti-type conjugative transfer relaxase TraA
VALYHFSAKILSRSSRNTVRAIAYRAGCKLYDERTGQTFNYEDKAVQHVELVLPQDAPSWAVEIQTLITEDRRKGVQACVDIVEVAEKRTDAQVWREFEFSLHRELTEEQNMTLAREFVQDQLCGRGMAAQMNFHFDVDEETAETNPHCHVVVTTRRLAKEGLSEKKELEWDKKSLLFELREQWANYSNFYLKLFGHDVQIDHRSNKERGIEMEPQHKRGRNVIEQEERAKAAGAKGAEREKELANNKSKNDVVDPLESDKDENFDKTSPVTDKMKAFHDAQLRNLYRIIRNPDMVLDIVTKHHATFMWGDVQKKLHQYVDNPHLFERLEAKLQQSSELVFLRKEGIKDFSGTPREEAIYTTRSMLKVEISLIEKAEELGRSKTHSVRKKHVESAIAKANEKFANEKLKKHGGLSQDQVKAIHHLVDEGQVKCVMGIAGAGKSTALGVCHEIWKAEGYVVYGLAPTGKASQNLEGSSLEDNGIPSTTLHKFLKSFKEGRCQYNSKSILVLDEAGMVDVERFEKLLSAVKKLGVKLIVVGDGAQLQPVEAGPAFRLVTEKLGRSELNTVIRQKEAWQKEATVLFGQQKTNEAIQRYAAKGCVHIIEEKLPALKDVLKNKDYENLVHLYETSHRVSSLIYREMARDVQKDFPELRNLYSQIKKHEDFKRYIDWKSRERDAADAILCNAKVCRPILEERAVDPLKIALLFKDKRDTPLIQHQKARETLKKCGLDHLIGVEKQRGQGVEVRQEAKEALIKEWHRIFKKAPEKSSLILAYSNKDVNDLNGSARALLKKSGHLSKEEFTYTTKKEVEDDFGRKAILKEEKEFSKGDRIVFTRNTYGLGVKNGSMGTIIDLNNSKVRVKLDEGKEISFAPKLNPYFTQGWAVTIHKSQGTTIDQTYVLASFEMSQNLAYVAMTRHRDGVKVFGSSLDFWRSETLPQVLAKSGEKLSAADYIDANSLTKLMVQDDHLLTKIFDRIASELDAMGTVSKKAFWQVADHFLGVNREKEIRMASDSIREEVRAEKLLKKEKSEDKSEIMSKTKSRSLSQRYSGSLQAEEPYRYQYQYQSQLQSQLQPQLQSHPQSLEQRASTTLEPFHYQDLKKTKVFQEQKATKNETVSPFETRLSEMNLSGASPSEASLSFLENTDKSITIPKRALTQKPAFPNKEVVENALKENIADFADHVFASIGEDFHKSSSSATQRRYGKNGHISVNLRTGGWINFKDSELSGGPLHMLTKLKGLSFKEALEYGAHWARLSPEQHSPQKKSFDTFHAQKVEKETLAKESEVKEVQQKIKWAQNLWSKGHPIQGTIAERYLKEHRKIDGKLPQDFRYLPNVKVAGEQSVGKSYPCLMVAARSNTGDITAVQLTFLDPKTANKANIPVQKRSYGLLKGSAVTVQAGKDSNHLFIAEGIETTLSLKESRLQGTIKASLGLANIGRIEPQNANTHIVICGDHDDPKSPAAKSLQKSVHALQERGFKVSVIKPDTLGEDFNDVLKKQGPEGIREIIKQSVPQALIQPSVITKEASASFQEVFNQIAKSCEKILYEYIAKENISMTSELKERIPLQADWGANCIFYAHILNGTTPTEKETKQFLARAKYELDRIPHIKEKLTDEWQKRGNFNEKKDPLLIHMIAERQASIEGRLFFEAKQEGLKPPLNISQLAEAEFKAHRAEANILTQKLTTQYSLSKNAATECAKNMLRYQETHGTKPTNTQMTAMAEIAHKIEEKFPDSFEKDVGSHNLLYLRRMNADSMFRERCYENRHTISHEQDMIKMQEKALMEVQKQRIEQEISKQKEKDFSLSM